MEEKIRHIFGEKAPVVIEGIKSLTLKYKKNNTQNKWISENDVMLISYGDSIIKEGEKPLETLATFFSSKASGCLTAIHILPCFPYTSDDGFSVVDYRIIDENLGDWDDIKNLSTNLDIMLDAVINHCSASSLWFKEFLAGNDKYKNYFIEADPTLDYSSVIRPRALPLLTEFASASGKKYIWTTFSSDQVDLNFSSPELFLEILDVLSVYVANSSRFIRLDAVGFLHKKIGTTCMHLDETHILIQIIRDYLDIIAPGTILITETNVPHKDNISYFGNGNEAHIVYQFPLPPLTLYSFYEENATKLMDWAASLEETPHNTTFLNFLASHDGIGVRPTEGILTKEDLQMICEKVFSRGGLVSYRDNGDGTKSPYELNISYMDALTDLDESNEVRSKRMLAAHVILLSVIGMPAIYIHSLLGSRNNRQDAISSGINRRINRAKLSYDELCCELESDTLRRIIFESMKNLICLRREQSAFSPTAKQLPVFYDKRIFSIIRHNEATGARIIVLVNVSMDNVGININKTTRDIISGKQISGIVELKPNEYYWLLED